MNLNEHPVFQAIYDACQECEKLPASEQQTRTVTAIGAIAPHATALLTEFRHREKDCEAARLDRDRFQTELRALRELAKEFLESPPDDADGYWENFSKRLLAALAGATEAPRHE